ncbi:MAG: VCBS repeat-containing protein, partial [Solirubrobacterales bacterium]
MRPHLRISLTFVVFLCVLACGPVSANAAGVVGLNPTSEAWITEHPSSQWWSLSTALTGDVNGDGRTDAIADVFGTWNVALSTGSNFAPSTPWLGTFAVPSSDMTPLVGDVNGDGKDDAVAAENNGVWKVALANSGGTQFNAPSVTPFLTGFGSPVSGSTFTYMLGDVNGDGKADAVYFEKNYAQAKGTWNVALSNGTAFVPAPAPWATGVGAGYSGTTVAKLADVTGDGRSDAVYVENGKWTAAPSTGTRFGYSASPTSPLSSTLGTSNPLLADVNGDGKADGLSVSSSGAWTVALASTTPSASGDIPSFGAPAAWGKGAQAPTFGIATGATPPPTQYFAVDLDGTVPSGAAKGTAESLAVKGGTWWGWAAKTPADFKASGPP